MSFAAISLIAVGLAMDAFAVSVAEGIVLRRITASHTLRVAVYFGGFQAAMPIAGWLAGRSLRGFIAGWDHWVAFGLLLIVGGKMIVDSFSGFETDVERKPSRGLRLIVLSIATSIDALAVGLSLGVLHVPVWWAAAWIGCVTGVLCAVGIHLGDRVSGRVEHFGEFVAGLILVGIGVKTVIEHLGKGI